jgi:hypothetical protein
MINYTDHLTRLMEDVVLRVPTLSFIDIADVLVFGRFGKLNTDGALATCHCLGLPVTEPGYYFWRDRATGEVTRRSEWFVTKTPVVTIDGHKLKYLISFALPRFCNQSLTRSRKERFYRRADDAWIAKLDTVIHELYHVDPGQRAIRPAGSGPDLKAARSHDDDFLADVARMVGSYLDSGPDPATYDFLRHPFETLDTRYGGVTATVFRPFPSYPQRFVEPLVPQPGCDGDPAAVKVEPVTVHRHHAARYTEQDLQIRRFSQTTSRALPAVTEAPRAPRIRSVA